MPISQLMRKLAGRESPRHGQEGSQLTTAMMNYQATAMDCDFCQPPTVTAEIDPMQYGRRSPCSPSSTASTSEEALERLPTAPFGRMASAPMGFPATSVELLPSSHAAVSTQPAAARALRARGKAALRSSTLETCEPIPSLSLGEGRSPRGSLQQQTSFEQIGQLDSFASRSSSVEAQLSPTYDMSTSPSGHSYQRAATVPLPAWASALTININTGPGSTNALAAPSTSPPAPGTVPVAPAAAEEDEFGSPLHSPLVSPCCAEATAGDDAFWCEDCELHCEWEDGVVASWFKDLEHSKLLDMLHTDEELETVADDQRSPTTSRISETGCRQCTVAPCMPEGSMLRAQLLLVPCLSGITMKNAA